MSNKITIVILSVLTIFFLTAQTCSFGTTSSGLAADCVGEGDIICDDTEAYECGLAAYGTGYYVSRSSENDAEYCGAVDTTDTDGDGVYDADDLCEGYDDAEDADADGTADGCDTDDDDDGYTDRIELRAGSDPNDASDVPATRCTDDCEALGYLCDERAAACYSSCMIGSECAEGYMCSRISCVADTDGDGVADIDDLCSGDDTVDTDADGTPDDCDLCVGYDDATDVDADGTPDDCDSLIDSDGDGVADSDDVCSGYDDTADTDADLTPDGCDEDADGDELLDSIETDVGLDPTTDELSSYELLNFDADNTDFAPASNDADDYIEYFGPFGSTIVGRGVGDVSTATDADWGTVVDLTSTTSDDYVIIRPPTTTPDYWDVSTFFVMKARVKGDLSAAGAALIVEHPLTSTADEYQFAFGIMNDGATSYYGVAVEMADGTEASIFGGTPSDTEWQEVIILNSGSTLYMYVDGVSVGTPVATSALMSSTEPLFFGYKNPGDTATTDTYDYEGYIDSVQIWGD